MEKGLVLKVWKMDYSFLIKNYLDQSLWEKTWTLFQYKNFEIQLYLDQIMTRDQKLRFSIKVLCHKNSNDNRSYYTDDAYYSLKLNDISFLKRAINSAIWNCINNIERIYYIEYTDEYQDLDNQVYEEKYKLRQIANDFLDEAGVTSDSCREAYIDAYIDENCKMIDLRDEYVYSRQFQEITDFWIAWLSCLEDETRKEKWLEKIKTALTDETWKENLEEAQKYIEYMETEEYTEEKKSNLEEI